MKENILIRGGRLIDPLFGTDEVADLAIAEGRILEPGFGGRGFAPDRIIEAEGHIVAPGFVDLCARFREPGLEHKATIRSESLAAVSAGVTSALIPPDGIPVTDTPAVAQLIQEIGNELGLIRLRPIGALTRGLKGKDLSEMRALRDAGCHAVSNAYFPVANSLILRRSMEYAASHDLLVIIRPEDPDLADDGCAHEGVVATRMGLRGIPHAAETVAVAKVLALIEQTGASVHFSLISSARAMRSIARAREKGLRVTADVGIHYLHDTESALEGFDANCHVRPPFRTEEDRDQLRQGLRDGVLSAICSDHQPHEPDAKLDAFPSTEPGISSLETLLPLMLQLVREGVFDLPTGLSALSLGPARVMGWTEPSLKPGAPADLVIFDPEETWTPDDRSWQSAGKNTPLWGRTLQGRVHWTLVGGRCVFERSRS